MCAQNQVHFVVPVVIMALSVSMMHSNRVVYNCSSICDFLSFSFILSHLIILLVGSESPMS